jgi:hypothetical protein
MTEDQKRCLRRAERRSGPAQPPRSSTPVSGIVESVPQKVQPPRPATPVVPSSISVPPDPLSPKKGKAKAATRTTAKVATRPEDQEHPMTTRSKTSASRARSLRPGVGGSGQKDTRVASSHPCKTWVRNLFLRGGFYPPANPAGSMTQRDRVTRRSTKGLGMHFPATWPTDRCPVQPSTPLGPDQVNVLLSFAWACRSLARCWASWRHLASKAPNGRSLQSHRRPKGSRPRSGTSTTND